MLEKKRRGFPQKKGTQAALADLSGSRSQQLSHWALEQVDHSNAPSDADERQTPTSNR